MNTNLPLVLSLVTLFAVVRPGAIEKPGDSQDLSNEVLFSDRPVFSNNESFPDLQVLSTDLSSSDLQDLSNDVSSSDLQVLNNDVSSSDQQVLSRDAWSSDGQVLSTDTSFSDQEVLSTDVTFSDGQISTTFVPDSDQQVSTTLAPDADQQVSTTLVPDADQQVSTTFPPDADWQVSTSPDLEDQSVEERMRNLRIQMLKYQIMSRLNMKNPPPPPKGPPSEFSRELVRLMMLGQDPEEGPEMYRQADGGERLVFHAYGRELECTHGKGNFCKMFRYKISASLNTSSPHLWIYKLGEFPEWMSVSVSLTSSLNEEKYLDTLYFAKKEAGWNKLPLPTMLLPASWNDSFSYQVEIKGDNIEHYGDHRPFLMVSKSYSVASRRRRDVDCDTNESCCVKPLHVSFAEIGFHWVLYPTHLDASYCAGTCRMDHGELRTHYERAMTKVIENNVALQEVLGKCWTLCCKPKQVVAFRVLYNDSNGVIHDQYIPELVVKSCSCS